jgi:glutathione synthase/RimK-type ligase-like ATP-grasp enzyme
MTPLLAIHDQAGSYSDRWFEFCRSEGIAHRRVNCHDTNIIAQLHGCHALLWHWRHHSPADQLLARQVIVAAERMGLKTFPDSLTSWHYDDKVAQKYLLEAVGAPLAPSYVFVEQDDALQWIATAEFPKVFKLRCGAGASGVALVRTREEAQRLCRRMFGRGRPGAAATYFSDARRKISATRGRRQWLDKLRRMPGAIVRARRVKRLLPRQRGYVYFQDYLPDNPFDTRITVVGGRAFAFRRWNRPNDFRASGSGRLDHDPAAIDMRCVAIAQDVARKLRAASLAFDFLFNRAGEPQIGEISYCYADSAVHDCPGHWDAELKWREGHCRPQDLILQDLLERLTP